MLAQALILATAATLSTLQADVSPPNPWQKDVFTHDGLMFDISAPAGTIGLGSDNAFLGFGYLQVNGRLYGSFEPLQLITHPDGGHTVATGRMPAPEGLVVFRKIYVPWKPGRNHARFLDVIENPTDTTKDVVVQFYGFSGLASLAEMIVRSDEYVIISGSPNSSGSPPAFGFLFQRGLRFMPGRLADLIFYDAGLLSRAYLYVKVKPHERVSFVHFVVQGMPRAAAAHPSGRGAAAADDTTADDVLRQLVELSESPDLSNLEPDEQRSLWNFFIDTDVNMDGYVNVLDMIIVRNDLGKPPESALNPRSDVNHDVRINILDMIFVRNDLGWPF